MTNQISARYGAIELRSLYPTFALRGLILAATLHLAIIGIYYLRTSLTGNDDLQVPMIHIYLYDLEQPPSIKNTHGAPPLRLLRLALVRKTQSR